MKFYPYEKGGGGSFSHAEGGGIKSFEVVLTRELEVLAIVLGGAKMFPPFKRGGGRKHFYPVLKGGRKKFQTQHFPIL